MFCEKCNKEVDNNVSFCSFCGNNLVNQIKPSNIEFTKGQKITIISLLTIIIALLSFFAFSPSNSYVNSRTVMIYVVGSNLETDNGIVSADLAAIDPNSIDLKNTNILLYTGGTEKWHNFVSNEDNGLYILKSSGFVKLESYEQLNLGDSKTLSDFLNYGYENYKTEKYDLILYNHGGAIDGAIYDDLSNDNLSLEDMEQALKDSHFNNDNKLETILFRTCLNGTIELANVFDEYADYLIGSEEVSYGSSHTDVLSFLNNVDVKDDGREYGIKFVETYNEQMSILNPFDQIIQTYSVIDLSNIDKLNQQLDEYISSIDLQKNYNKISKIRASVYQYGTTETAYDMIDLYEFVNQTKDIATKDNSKLLKTIKDTVVYNKTNESDSHGISIYFPYNGMQSIKNKFMNVYENLNYSEEYKNFIKKFNTMQKTPSEFKFDISKNKTELKDDNNEISLQLSQEQIDNYASATFTLFERDKEHPDYYKPIFNTDKVMLDNDGLLNANFKNMLVKVESDDKYEYMYTSYRNNTKTRTTTGIVYDNDLDILDDKFSRVVYLYFTDNEKGQPVFSTAKLVSDNERIDGIILDLKEYEEVELYQFTYRILDDKGNVMDSNEWESAPTVYGVGEELSKINMKYSSLDDISDYYGLFIITDVNGNKINSKLIKVGE